MSNYGADSNPNELAFQDIQRNLFNISDDTLQADQFTIDSNTAVFKFCDGTGRINIKFKADPSYWNY